MVLQDVRLQNPCFPYLKTFNLDNLKFHSTYLKKSFYHEGYLDSTEASAVSTLHHSWSQRDLEISIK